MSPLHHVSSRARRYCPKCDEIMLPMELQDVTVDICMRCKGMWFDAGELAHAARARFNERLSALRFEDAARTPFYCPACSSPLYERQLEKGSGILVDQCTRCMGMFLDRGEYSKAQRYLRQKSGRRRRELETLNGSLQVDKESSGLVMFQFLTGLPIELDVPQKLFSPVVTVLLALNIIAFVLTALNGLEHSIRTLGLVPATVASGQELYTFFTSMFLHGGVFHLLGNMYFLFIAGDNVEERFGSVRFLGFYLLCGLVAGLAHVLGEVSSTIPCVGASGAISGVIGAYVVLFPRNRFLVRWFYFFLYHVRFEWPAYVYFGLWLVLQGVYATAGVPGIAWWAHIGGFACGMGIALAVRYLPHTALAAGIQS